MMSTTSSAYISPYKRYLMCVETDLVTNAGIHIAKFAQKSPLTTSTIIEEGILCYRINYEIYYKVLLTGACTEARRRAQDWRAPDELSATLWSFFFIRYEMKRHIFFKPQCGNDASISPRTIASQESAQSSSRSACWVALVLCGLVEFALLYTFRFKQFPTERTWWGVIEGNIGSILTSSLSPVGRRSVRGASTAA
jgi:hypothetical protein